MDIYAFGTTLYYLLSMGQMPFGGFEDYKEDPTAFIKRKERGEYTPLKYYNPNLSDFWYEFTEICMEENPEERFQSSREANEYLSKFKIDKNANHLNPFTDKVVSSTNDELYVEIKQGNNETRVNLSSLILNNEHAVITIGRKNNQGIENDIQLAGSEKSIVSKRHATLQYVKSNWYIRDGQKVNSDHKEVWKHSLNGVYVNGKKIDPTEAAEVNLNDLVHVGDYTIKIIRTT